MAPRFSISNHPFGRGGSAVLLLFIYVKSPPTPAGLTLVYFIFQYSQCAHIHVCVKIQVSQAKGSFFLLPCTIHCVLFQKRAASRILHFCKAPNRHRHHTHKKSVLLHRQFLSLAPTPFGRIWGSTPPTRHPSGRPLLQRSD